MAVHLCVKPDLLHGKTKNNTILNLIMNRKVKKSIHKIKHLYFNVTPLLIYF